MQSFLGKAVLCAEYVITHVEDYKGWALANIENRKVEG
jgi:hypothetical protein